MINHVRTLLLNQLPQPADTPGVEFVDPTFRPVNLPQWMLDVLVVLLPPGSTDEQRNYRMIAVLRILHQIDLLPYTLMFDPRVTYTLSDLYDYLDTAPSQIQATQWLDQFERLDARTGVATQLFGDWSEYTTQLAALRILWYQSAEAVQRLGSFILAAAIQIERMRRGVPSAMRETTVTRVL